MQSLTKIDGILHDVSASKIIIASATFTLVIKYVADEIQYFLDSDENGLITKLKKLGFRTLKRLPYFGTRIQKEISEEIESFRKTHFTLKNGESYLTQLPNDGLSDSEIMSILHSYSKLDEVDYNKISGAIYNFDTEIIDLNSKVFKAFGYTNPLHPDVHPDVRRMEAEIVQWALHLFHGEENSAGVFTSGGTESIILAVLAARNRALEKGIRNPEILAPNSAHSAFAKAAHYLRIKYVRVPTNPHTQTLTSKDMRRYITKHTCLLVASFPSYPHGAIDPVEDIAKLGVYYDIPVHVDACLGGFLVCFMRDAGYQLPPFDFTVPGVMSISCDTHKYAFTPKGSSFLLTRTEKYRGYHIFTQPDWQGGLYSTPTIPGSRQGSCVASCWATMRHFGYSGYIETTRKIVNTTRKISNFIKKIPGLELMGNPEICVVAWNSKHFSIYRQLDLLAERRWILAPLQNPTGIHIAVTMQHTDPKWCDSFLKDVEETAAECMKLPSTYSEGSGRVYGTMQSLPDMSIVEEFCVGYYNAYYDTKY